jgi:hypothetical protein
LPRDPASNRSELVLERAELVDGEGFEWLEPSSSREEQERQHDSATRATDATSG